MTRHLDLRAQEIEGARQPRYQTGSGVATVLTVGTFDLFHAAHAELLAQCRKLVGDGRVVVGLNTDAFVRSYKHRTPVCTYDERAAVLRACRHVDEVVQNTYGADSKPLIEQVRPDFLAIGVDWAGKDYYRQMALTQAWLDERGITLLYVPHAWSDSITATDIRQRIRDLDAAAAETARRPGGGT